MKKVSLLLIATLALLGVSFAPVSAQETVVTVKLAELNNSGVYGGARIVPTDGGVRVELTLQEDKGSILRPAHIHRGTCSNLDPTPAYPLTNVINGLSRTDVPVSLDELTGGSYAINVHMSQEDAATYVACGNIEAVMTTGAEPAPGETGGRGGGEGALPPAGNSNSTTFVVMALLAFVMVVAGLRLATREQIT